MKNSDELRKFGLKIAEMRMNAHMTQLNLTDSDPPWISTERNSVRINSQALYKYMKENTPYRISDRGNIFRYDGKVYCPVSDREFKATIKDMLPVDYRNRRDWSAVFNEYKTDHPDFSEVELDADEDLIGFANGVLKLSTMELLPYEESFRLSRIVPCKYQADKGLDDAPRFSKFVNDLTNGNQEEISFLMEYIGAAVSNVSGFRFKKMLILVGEGNTGKSVLRTLVTRLLGEENCATIDIKRLQERFGTYQLYLKRLAGSGDMSNLELADLNVIKELTGGDTVMAEQKGKDGFTFLYRGLLWFNANALPLFSGDKGAHVYERFMIVRCDNIIPEEKRDHHLVEKLMLERDAIVSASIRYLKNAVDRDYRFTESEDMRQERERYAVSNNSLFLFIEDCCSIDFEQQIKLKVKRSVFHRIYKKFCQANNLKPEPERSIKYLLESRYHLEAHKTDGHYYYPLDLYRDVYDRLDPSYEFTENRGVERPEPEHPI